MPLTGGDVLLRCLRAQGVRAVFGMPGTQNIALYDAFHRSGDGIAHFLIRHEQGATLCANGFARASGEVAVALTVPGPGATNASTGILDAYTDCVPVLLVVGGYDRAIAHRDRAKMFHGLNQADLFRPITRYFGRPESANDIPRVVEEAFRAMFAGRPGPAVIEIPPDVAAETTEDFAAPPPFVPRVTGTPADPQAIRTAANQIRMMRRPVLIVGGDCVAANACTEVAEFAELLQVPVVYGRLGKGVLSDESPLVAGEMRRTRTAKLLEQADGVVSIGVRFTQIDTSNWSLKLPTIHVQLDRDERELGREYPISAGIAGSLAPALRQLCDELRREPPGPRDPAWSAIVQAVRDEWQSQPDVPVLSHIRRVLPRDGLVAVDVTALGYSSFDQFPVFGPRSLIYPCHSVTLGMAFPAAIGAKIAQPERAVVSFSGDGGFLMTCNELATAAEYGVGVVAVVVKDDCLTAIKGSQRQAFDGRTIDTAMQSPDFAALARACGAHAVSTRCVDDLPKLISEGLTRRGPSVIEVRLEDRVDELIAAIPWLRKP